MKVFRFIGTTAVFLVLGLTVPAYSRQERQDKPKDNERHQQQDKPAEKQQRNSKPERQAQPQANHQQDQQRPQQQQKQQAKGQQNQQQRPQPQSQTKSATKVRPQTMRPQDQKLQKQAKGGQEQQRQQPQHQTIPSARQRSPEQVRQQQAAWQGDRAHNWKSDHRTWQQRGGYTGYRITDDRFRAYYGQDHQFRIFSLPVMFVGGQRRFQYGGYWFALVDPWPEYWSNNWYDTDEMWVDYYAGGYYLCNRSHPGDRIAISFYLN